MIDLVDHDLSYVLGFWNILPVCLRQPFTTCPLFDSKALHSHIDTAAVAAAALKFVRRIGLVCSASAKLLCSRTILESMTLKGHGSSWVQPIASMFCPSALFVFSCGLIRLILFSFLQILSILASLAKFLFLFVSICKKNKPQNVTPMDSCFHRSPHLTIQSGIVDSFGPRPIEKSFGFTWSIPRIHRFFQESLKYHCLWTPVSMKLFLYLAGLHTHISCTFTYIYYCSPNVVIKKFFAKYIRQLSGDSWSWGLGSL